MSKDIFTMIRNARAVDSHSFIAGLPIIAELKLLGPKNLEEYIQSPYNKDLNNILIAAVEQTLLLFPGAIVAHIWANEIVIVVYYSNQEKLPFKGKKYLFISRIVSDLTTHFVKELAAKNIPEISGVKLSFDCQASNVASTLNAVEWLQAMENKAKHIFAVLKSQEFGLPTTNLSTKTLVNNLKEKNIDIETFEEYINRGTFIKKRKVENGSERKIEKLKILPIHEIYNKLGVFFGNEEATPIKPNMTPKKRN